MSMPRNLPVRILAATVAAGLLPATASAAPWDDETFRIAAGGFFSGTDVEIQLDRTEGVGSNLDFGNDLGNDSDSTVGRFSGYFRLAKRHRFYADYFKVSQDGNTVLDRDVDFGNLEIPAGSGVESEFSLAATQIHYGYSFVQNEDVELAVSLGVTYLEIDAGASAFSPTATLGRERADASAPVPVIGASVDYAINDQWLLRAAVQGISADVGDYDGSVWSYGGAVEWLPWQNFGFGLAYGGLSGDLDVDADNWQGSIDVSVDGPFAYVTARF